MRKQFWTTAAALVIYPCCALTEERLCFGVDRSNSAILSGRYQAAKEGLGDKCHFELTLDSEFGRGLYDFVLAKDVIEHIQDDEQWLRRVAAALKPNGVLRPAAVRTPSLAREPARLVIRVRSFTVANVDSIGFVDRMCFQWAPGKSKCARSRGTSANRALTALDTSSHSLGQSVASPSRRLSGSRHTSSHATLVSPGVGASWGACPARWRSGVSNSIAVGRNWRTMVQSISLRIYSSRSRC